MHVMAAWGWREDGIGGPEHPLGNFRAVDSSFSSSVQCWMQSVGQSVAGALLAAGCRIGNGEAKQESKCNMWRMQAFPTQTLSFRAAMNHSAHGCAGEHAEVLLWSLSQSACLPLETYFERDKCVFSV